MRKPNYGAARRGGLRFNPPPGPVPGCPALGHAAHEKCPVALDGETHLLFSMDIACSGRYAIVVADLNDRISDMDSDEALECIDEMINVLTTLDDCIGVISQLRAAIETRDVIGQAKGILMATQDISANEAFEILQRASQRSNQKLRDIAAELAARVESRRRDLTN